MTSDFDDATGVVHSPQGSPSIRLIQPGAEPINTLVEARAFGGVAQGPSGADPAVYLEIDLPGNESAPWPVTTHMVLTLAQVADLMLELDEAAHAALYVNLKPAV